MTIRSSGRVTNIGFAMRLAANSPIASARGPARGRSVQRTHARIAPNPSAVDSVSFRSTTQATDSTCSGWMAKSSAANPLRPGRAVTASSHAKSRRVAIAWRTTFVT